MGILEFLVIDAPSVVGASYRAAEATRNLTPKIGRARPHAEKSIDIPDPGAVSMALIIHATSKIMRKHCS